MTESTKSRFALAAGGLAAFLASACCLGPLVLVLLGLGGAWAGTLVALEPYRPWFLGAAVLSLFLAARRIFRPRTHCEADQLCAVPGISRAYRLSFWFVAVLLLVAIGFPYLMPLLY